ncbi:MAG: isochorismatase family protein [Neisseria sp.]|uniref:isochorismatase family protein n=1 Tax=Neisseria sp. TaxID=192066 RepID=UPI0026DADFBD|nr:isochorismatase family protein [Neisseria sp.]MDO4641069.1 isochorismatase family protein [Neisseria sp.]
MNTISIDFQPQRSFLEQSRKVSRAHMGEMIAEMNKNALFADKRILIQSQPVCAADKLETESLKSCPFGGSGFTNQINAMEGSELLLGMPSENRYNRVFLVDCMGDARQSLCFHDKEELKSTGLIEWLLDEQASTLIIGGTAIDRSLKETVKQLRFFGNWDIVVNLAACRGFDAEETLAAINEMRRIGVRTITNSIELISKLVPAHAASPEMMKISHALKFSRI